MKIKYLKDGLFDLLIDNSEELGISDIETHENENAFGISTCEVRTAFKKFVPCYPIATETCKATEDFILELQQKITFLQ